MMIRVPLFVGVADIDVAASFLAKAFGFVRSDVSCGQSVAATQGSFAVLEDKLGFLQVVLVPESQGLTSNYGLLLYTEGVHATSASAVDAGARILFSWCAEDGGYQEVHGQCPMKESPPGESSPCSEGGGLLNRGGYSGDKGVVGMVGLLGLNGLRVLLVDRALAPSPKMPEMVGAGAGAGAGAGSRGVDREGLRQ
ncbi:unnamed protein product, partial [Discosporangium mesarthrocarpum]